MFPAEAVKSLNNVLRGLEKSGYTKINDYVCVRIVFRDELSSLSEGEEARVEVEFSLSKEKKNASVQDN